MKYITVALLALISSAYAAEDVDFYKKKISEHWTVNGLIPSDKMRNAACYAENVYTDGSIVQFTRDLVDDEVYMSIFYTVWEMKPDVDDKEKVRIILLNEKGVVDSGSFDWALVSKNRINIHDLPKPFAKSIWTTQGIRIVMPSAENVGPVYFPGRLITLGIVECIDSYKAWLKKNPEKIPDISAKPGDASPPDTSAFRKKEKI